MTESNSKKQDIYIQQKEEFDYLISVIESIEKGNSVGILLYGPPGVGKTLLSISLARRFKATYYIIDGSPDLDRRDIEGNWEISKGETHFNYGPLTLAIRDANKNGISFIIINEINAIREAEQISLNSLLSENHINLISKGFEKHALNKQGKLIVIGTMNKGVLGVNKLQEAFEDRFVVCLEISYPIKNKEVEIATKIAKCNETIAEIVVDSARQIRKQAIQDCTITKIFSTRLIVNFCALVSKMSPKYLKDNIENIIVNKLGENQEEKKSISMILNGKMFEQKLRDMLEIEQKKQFIIQAPPTSKTLKGGALRNTASDMMSMCFRRYIKRFGMKKTIKPDGTLMWRPLGWMWDRNRNIFQTFMKLTEITRLPALYRKATGNRFLHNHKVTLKYIRWLNQNKSGELVQFFRKKYHIF